MAKQKQIGLANLKTLAGAFAGYKRKGDAEKTAKISAFVRGMGRADRLAFSVAVAKKLGRAKANEAAEKQLIAHFSAQDAALRDAYEQDKTDLIANFAYRNGLPYFAPTEWYNADAPEGKKDPFSGHTRIYCNTKAEKVSLLVEDLAREEIAPLGLALKEELAKLASRREVLSEAIL